MQSWGGRRTRARGCMLLVFGALFISLLGVGCSESGSPQEKSPSVRNKTSQALDPARLYRRYCLVCHQANGQGVPNTFPPLAGSSWVQGEERRVIRIVLHGLQGKIRVDGKDYNGIMPGLANQMSDEEVAAVLNYVRNRWGNQAPEISVDSVSQVREQAGARTSMWTEAELLRD